MKRRHTRRHAFAALALLAFLGMGLLSCGSSAAQGGDVLRFTAIPDSDRTELESKFRPLAEHLSEVLGHPVEYVPTADYSASVEMFKNGDVQLAWFGGLTGVQARAAVPGARAIAQGRVDPTFKSYLIASSASGIEPSEEFPVEALRGKRFTFGSQQSTSGRLMPEHFIRQATGQAPEDFFSEVSFSGSHDNTAKLVAAGSFDAGAINFRTFDLLVERGEIDTADCRVVWTTPEYADYNWTVHPAVDRTFGEGSAAALQEALVGLERADLLEAVQRADGLIPATDAEFEGIAVVARELGFLR